MKEFIVNNIYQIISACLAIVSILSAIISYLINRHKVKSIQQKDEAKAEAKQKVLDACDQFVKDAERLKNYSSAEKKQYVMTRAIAIANNLLSSEEIDAYVEKQVELTNNVNVSRIKQVK